MDRTGVVTFQGNPLTLTGEELKVGDKAPNFTVLNKELQPVSLSDFTNKLKVISVTPSLDTPVCEMQAKRFNQEGSNLSSDVAMINISMDLPFALARFCSTQGIKGVETLSDHKDASFGQSFGILIKELRLLARSIFILDKDNFVKYIEIVPEMTNHPNYDTSLAKIKELSG